MRLRRVEEFGAARRRRNLSLGLGTRRRRGVVLKLWGLQNSPAPNGEQIRQFLQFQHYPPAGKTHVAQASRPPNRVFVFARSLSSLK